jgi:hypothetical protein
MKNTKTLNVKKVDSSEISGMWNLPVNIEGELYVRCNAQGEIDWEKTSIYRASELIIRNNVVILK